MQEARRNLYVGLFVLCGLLIVGALAILFGSGATAFFSGGGYPLNIHFKSAAGVRQDNQVTLGGIEVGRVLDVGFIDPNNLDAGVRVVVQMRKDIVLRNGSRAITTEPALGLSRPPIEIIPGDAGLSALPPNSTIPGEVRGAVESIVPAQIVKTLEKTATQLGEAAENLTPVLQDLHEIMVKRSPTEVDRPGGQQGNLSSAMARFDGTIKHVNDVLGDPETRSRLKETIDNLYAMSEDGKAAVADFRATAEEARGFFADARTAVGKAQGTIEHLDEEVVAIGRDARDTLERGSRLLDTTQEIADGLKRGEGTVGLLLNDAKLYESLVLTAERLGEAAEEIRVLMKEWQEGKVRVAF
ncbi:MAG: MlaD family protein [Phycisphaerae bacterium]|jgi:ABC-type transporter Mla subunit MlaD